MATKVRGEAIKEDSIPLRGLKSFRYKLFDAEDYAEFKKALENKKSGFVIIQDYSIFQEVYITNSRHFGGNNYSIEGIANGKLYFNNFIDISDNPTIIFKTEHEIKPDVPNWNAQEGEAGYIENKPFYSKGDIRQIDVNGEYSIVIGEFNIGDRIDVSWDLKYYNDEVFRGSTSFVIQEDGEEATYYYQENDFYIWGGTYVEMYAYSAGDSHYGKVIVTVNGEIKTIEEKYIPDTVLKTTPQTLSDENKNQALANLGIDNTKYMLLGTPDNGFNIQEFINKFGFIPELRDNDYGGYIGDLAITNKELFIDAVLCCDFENGVSKCIYVNNNTVSFMFMGYITNGHILVSYAENDINSTPVGIHWEPIG